MKQGIVTFIILIAIAVVGSVSINGVLQHLEKTKQEITPDLLKLDSKTKDHSNLSFYVGGKEMATLSQDGKIVLYGACEDILKNMMQEYVKANDHHYREIKTFYKARSDILDGLMERSIEAPRG